MRLPEHLKAGRVLLLAVALIVVPTLFAASDAAAAQDQQAPPPDEGTIVVYFLDHQFLPAAEVELVQREITEVFAAAGLETLWVPDDSPRRDLYANELRLIILPSDGTRWFHGPTNVIGIAPHDDAGTGRNCFIFYRQAIWFRQQAVFRCREAIQARTEAAIRGVEVDPFIESYAPADCGDYLPALTAMIVARAAAHEMVHILLNQLIHSPGGLMRDSFDIGDWFTHETDLFRLGSDEVDLLRELLGGVPEAH